MPRRTGCWACGSGEPPERTSVFHDRTGVRRTYLRCASCGHLRQPPSTRPRKPKATEPEE